MRASMPLRYVKAPMSSGSIGRNREREKAMKKMNLVLGFAAAASLLVTACGSSKTETTAAADRGSDHRCCYGGSRRDSCRCCDGDRYSEGKQR